MFASNSGDIVAGWKKTSNAWQINITIPPNTVATVYVPQKNETGVTESGKPVANNNAVKFIKYRKGYSINRWVAVVICLEL